MSFDHPLDPPALPGVSHRWLAVRGARLHVAEAGAGEPLLLLHGWPQHWLCWQKLIPELAKHYRVIAPDLRGFGWSEATREGYSKEDLADDVLALMSALGHARFRMIGHDWGGWIGFLMGMKAPERLSRFVALSIPHPWQHDRPLTWKMAKRLSYQVVMASPLLGRLVWHFPQRLHPSLSKAVYERAAWTDAVWNPYTAQFREPARAWASTQMYRRFLLEEAPAIRKGRYRDSRLMVPTLHLVGERDPVGNPSALAGYEPHAPQLRLETVPRCGHFLPEERPEVVLEKALPFLRGAP